LRAWFSARIDDLFQHETLEPLQVFPQRFRGEGLEGVEQLRAAAFKADDRFQVLQIRLQLDLEIGDSRT
jgi:hypothetical protein